MEIIRITSNSTQARVCWDNDLIPPALEECIIDKIKTVEKVYGVKILSKASNTNEVNPILDNWSRGPGAPSWLDDIWAWGEIFECHKDPLMVQNEWWKRDNVSIRFTDEANGLRQFRRINHKEWAKPQK